MSRSKDRLWFEQEPYPAKIAKYKVLYQRHQAYWRTESGVNRVRGFLLADGVM